jgi:hypothetical protein
MLLSVPGGISMFDFPEIVTVPDLVGCFSCRWLPRILFKTQPSSFNILSTVLTFIGPDWQRESA